MTSPFLRCILVIGEVRWREGFAITTVIARKNADGTVDLGWDSQSTGGGNTAYVEKVAAINDQFYIGVAGRTRYGNLLKYIDVPALHDAEHATGNYDAFGYLITQVIPAWVSGLSKQFDKIPDQKEDWPDGVALIVLQGRIFTVHHDFTVTEADREFDGIGSGSDYAIGAMAAGKSVKKALEVAAELDLFTGGDLRVMKGLK